MNRSISPKSHLIHSKDTVERKVIASSDFGIEAYRQIVPEAVISFTTPGTPVTYANLSFDGKEVKELELEPIFVPMKNRAFMIFQDLDITEYGHIPEIQALIVYN